MFEIYWIKVHSGKHRSFIFRFVQQYWTAWCEFLIQNQLETQTEIQIINWDCLVVERGKQHIEWRAGI